MAWKTWRKLISTTWKENVCQWFVNAFSSPEMKYCTLLMKTVAETTLLGCPWHSSPSISAGITVYRNSADNSLRVQFSVPHAPLHPQWRLSFCVSWYGNHFSSNLSYLFCLVWPPRGSEAHRETDCTDCAELQKPCRPCQSWRSFLAIRCELAISMGLTGRSLCQCKHRPLCFFFSHSLTRLPSSRQKGG